MVIYRCVPTAYLPPARFFRQWQGRSRVDRDGVERPNPPGESSPSRFSVGRTPSAGAAHRQGPYRRHHPPVTPVAGAAVPASTHSGSAERRSFCEKTPERLAPTLAVLLVRIPLGVSGRGTRRTNAVQSRSDTYTIAQSAGAVECPARDLRAQPATGVGRPDRVRPPDRSGRAPHPGTAGPSRHRQPRRRRQRALRWGWS